MFPRNFRKALLGVMLAACLSSTALADYDISFTVDTSGYKGTSGQLDLQFNPTGGSGVVTALVTLANTNDASNFSVSAAGSGIAPSPNPLGSVTGTTFPFSFSADNTNGPGSNELTLDLTYGSVLAMNVHVTTPDSTSTATFFAALYDNSSSVISPSSGSSGATIQVDLNPGGNPPTTNAGTGASVNVTPEPSSYALMALGIACVAAVRRKMHRLA